MSALQIFLLAVVNGIGIGIGRHLKEFIWLPHAPRHWDTLSPIEIETLEAVVASESWNRIEYKNTEDYTD